MRYYVVNCHIIDICACTYVVNCHIIDICACTYVVNCHIIVLELMLLIVIVSYLCC